MKPLLLFLFICINYTVYSSQCYSTGDGNWEAITTWSCGAVPACGDTIIITPGDKVTINSQINMDDCLDHTSLVVEGELAFTNGNKLIISCNSTFSISPDGVVYKDGNGAGNSTLIEQCSNILWSAGDGDFYGPFNWFDPLPIELVSFNATSKKDHILIEWVTASERNNSFFTIERSQDGQVFEPIKTIEGAGNSNYEISYEEKDFEPILGVSYYRLKQTDFDGETTLSDIKSVKFIRPNIIVYPNPSFTNDDFTITSGQYSDLDENLSDYSLEVISVEGKVVPATYINNDYQIQVNGIKEAGTYFIRIFDKTSSHKVPLIVY